MKLLLILSLVLMALAPASAQEMVKSSARPPSDPPETNVAERMRLLESELERQNSKLDQLQKTLVEQQQTIQALIENQFKDKNPLPKAASFVDTSLVDELQKSGFIDSVGR